MDVKEVAAELVAMWKRGEWLASGDKYWADDVRSVEPMDGPMGDIQGNAQVHGKGEWWEGAHDIHSAEVSGGPWFNGDQFVVRFTMDVTQKQSGQRMQLDETALYKIKDGKIAEERFFYGGQ